MKMLWTVDQIVAATSGRPVGDMPEGISGVSIDTRTLQAGEGFFAIKGDRFDGHDFLTAAMAAGAGLAVVDESKLVSLGSIKLPLVVVGDVLDAMRKLGEVARMRSKAQVIAITGSVGKTSTKEMMRTVLEASGPVHASAASFNNHWGVPLSLARMPEETRFGIFEIGMNNGGEITPLVKMVRPHVSIITNVAAAHLGAFDSIDDIARAKAEIYSGLVPGGYALINHDDRRYVLLRDLAKNAGIDNLLSFGTKRGSYVWMRSMEEDAEGTDVSVRIDGKDYEYRVSIPGEHVAMNSLAVLGAAHLAGADMDKTLPAFSRLMPTKGRGTRYVIGGSGAMGTTLIDESYNANPASMDAALRMLKNFQGVSTKRRIAVLGDMLELGKQSKKLHEALTKPITEAGVDLVFLVGQEMENLAKLLPKEKLAGHFQDADAALPRLLETMKGGDVVMFKASNSLGFSKMVQDVLDSGNT